jgi:hypothetical protein
MNQTTVDNKLVIIDCLKQKTISGKRFDTESYLKGKGISEELIPQILVEIARLEDMRRAAKSRIQEGSVITAIGLGGISYAFANEKDGTAWMLWSLAGLGVLASGLWKKRNLNQIKINKP